MRGSGSTRVSVQSEKENPMRVYLTLEASQPCGTTYRLGLGAYVPFGLASVVVALSRLF